MPKYLVEACYNAEGAKGIARDGGSGRHAAAKKAIESLGGKLESFYFAFGDTDVFAVFDLPDNASAAEKLRESREHMAAALAQDSKESLRPQTHLPQPNPTPAIPKRRKDVMRNWF